MIIPISAFKNIMYFLYILIKPERHFGCKQTTNIKDRAKMFGIILNTIQSFINTYSTIKRSKTAKLTFKNKSLDTNPSAVEIVSISF